MSTTISNTTVNICQTCYNDGTPCPSCKNYGTPCSDCRNSELPCTSCKVFVKLYAVRQCLYCSVYENKGSAYAKC